MTKLAKVLRYCWNMYKQASREYFAPIMVLWNGVNGRVHKDVHHRTGHIGKA